MNRSVIGLDIDAESLEIAYANADELEVLFVYVITLFACKVEKAFKAESFTLVLMDICSLLCFNTFLELFHLQLDMDFIQCDISNLKWRGIFFTSLFSPERKYLSWLIDISLCVGQIVETVVMNPPFGTRRKGADMDFLSSAMKVRWCSPYNWYPRLYYLLNILFCCLNWHCVPVYS